MPHLEFIVAGPPVSSQTRDRTNLGVWKQTIRTEAMRLWAGSLLAGKLKCTILNFHEGDRPSLDDDNMVKPIRDALNGAVYEDDSQIRYSETIHVSIDDPLKVRRASSILLAGLGKGEEFLYVRIDDVPDFLQLPT